MSDQEKNPLEKLKEMPKVDLHRHLEGSLRVESMREIVEGFNIELPQHSDFRRLVQVMQDEPLTSQNFLSKFAVLRLLYVSPEVIRRFAYEVVADAAADGVKYLELIFTPVALTRQKDYPLGEAMDWVLESVKQAEVDLGIRTRLIASANRHESVELAEKVAQLSVDRLDKGIAGLGLVGNEAEFPAAPFLGIFTEARQAGLELSIHAGEWNGPENVREAIEDFNAKRIGHGVRVMENPAVVDLARERATVFEVCLSSNYHSGVFNQLEAHPIKEMLNAGLNVTLNTDDPGISNITLTDEYVIAFEKLGFSLEQIRQRILAAAQAAFLSAEERRELLENLKKAF